MPDIADASTAMEELERSSLITAHNARRQNTEPPDEDADGNRFCLDCGEVIPQERVIAANAVRCIDCAQCLERLANKFAAQAG